MESFFLNKCTSSQKMNLYQLFFRIGERFFGHNVVNFSPTRSFLLETCAWKPAWYVFQNRNQVYPESSRNAGSTKSIQNLFGDWNIGIVSLTNGNSISNFHDSGVKCACYHLMSALEKKHINRGDTYCWMWWKKLSGVTRSRCKKDWTSCLWIGWYLVTALRWKFSWNNLLCFRHHEPYGCTAKLIVQFILQQTAFKLLASLEVKGIRYTQIIQHRHLFSVGVICRPFLKQVGNNIQGA